MIYKTLGACALFLGLGLNGWAEEEGEPLREASIWDDADWEVTHYYRGQIGKGLKIQLALALPDEDSEDEEESVSGHYLYERHGKVIKLKGGIVDEQSEKPRFRFVEVGEGEKITGKLDFQWQDPAGVNIEGMWTSADGTKELPIRLQMVALASQTELRSARCSLELHSPYFLGKGKLAAAGNTAVDRLQNQEIEDYREWESRTLADMVEEADEDFEFPGIPYTSSCRTTPIYCGSDVVSLAVFYWSYAGGARPNYWYGSATFAEDSKGNVQELELADLFSAGTPWQKIVGEKLAFRLRAQGSVWGIAEEDAEVTEPEDFGDFVVNPEGIAFVFSPYVNGEYYVAIKWSEIAGITDRKRWPFVKRWTPSGVSAGRTHVSR